MLYHLPLDERKRNAVLCLSCSSIWA